MRRQAVNIYFFKDKVVHGKSVVHTLKKICKVSTVHISARINILLDNIFSISTIAWNLSGLGVL